MDKFQALQRENKKYFRKNGGRHGGAFLDFNM